MRADKKRRRTDNYRSRVHKSNRKFPYIRARQVELPDIDIAVNQSADKMLNHFPRAVVHRYVSHYHLVFHVVADPVLVGIDNKLRPLINRAVTRCNHLNVKRFELFKIIFYRRPERHHDFRVIPLRAFVNHRLIFNKQVA